MRQKIIQLALIIILHMLLFTYLLWVRAEIGAGLIIGLSLMSYLGGLGSISISQRAHELGYITTEPRYKAIAWLLALAVILLVLAGVYKEVFLSETDSVVLRIVNILVLFVPALLLAYIAPLSLRMVVRPK